MAMGKKRKQGQWGEGEGVHDKARVCSCGNQGSSQRSGKCICAALAEGLKYKKHLGEKKMKREAEFQAVNSHSLIYQIITASCVEGRPFYPVLPQENKTVSTSSYFVRRSSTIF